MADFSSSNPFGVETSRNDNGTDATDVGGSMAGFTGSNSLAGNDVIEACPLGLHANYVFSSSLLTIIAGLHNGIKEENRNR